MSIKKKIVVIVLAVVGLLLFVGAVGAVLAWKTNLLDKWLPASVKEFFGKEIDGGAPTDDQVRPTEEKLSFLKDGEVWLADKDGTSPQQLTDEGGNITVFHFSPTGESLAYIVEKEFDIMYDSSPAKERIGYQLIERDLSSGQKKVLVEHLDDQLIVEFVGREWSPGGAGLNGFSYSPDGKKIVYTRTGVWVLDIEAGVSQQLIIGLGLEETWKGAAGPAVYSDVMTWSPDGQKVLISYSPYEGIAFLVIDIETKATYQAGGAYIGGGNLVEDFWDNSSLLMTYLLETGYDPSAGVDRSELYTAPLSEFSSTNENQEIKRTVLYENDGLFSPVVLVKGLGKIFFSVYYSSNDSRTTAPLEDDEIYTVGLDGRSLEKLTNLKVGPFEGYSAPTIYKISVSSDGAFVAFSILTKFDMGVDPPTSRDYELKMFNLNNREVSTVTTGNLKQIEWVSLPQSQ